MERPSQNHYGRLSPRIWHSTGTKHAAWEMGTCIQHGVGTACLTVVPSQPRAPLLPSVLPCAMEVRRPLRGQMWLKYGTVALLLWTGYFLLTHLTFPHPRPPGASLPGKTPQPVSAQRERPLNVTAAAMGDPPADPPIQFAAPLAAPATLDGAPEPDLDPCNTESPFFAGRSGMERDYLREVHHYAFGRAWGLGMPRCWGLGCGCLPGIGEGLGAAGTRRWGALLGTNGGPCH